MTYIMRRHNCNTMNRVVYGRTDFSKKYGYFCCSSCHEDIDMDYNISEIVVSHKKLPDVMHFIEICCNIEKDVRAWLKEHNYE